MRTRAIILKKQATNEYDQIVTCYTEEFGKVAAVAKSASKPSSIQGMHLDVFNLVDFDLISGRGMPIITGAQSDNSYRDLKSNLPSMAIAYFLAEIIDKHSFEYQRDDSIWNFLINFLESSGEIKSGHGLMLRERQMELLNILGYQPNWEECAFCSLELAQERIVFSPEAGGAMCQGCFFEGRRGIFLNKSDLSSVKVLNNIFESILGKKLSSLNFMDYVLE